MAAASGRRWPHPERRTAEAARRDEHLGTRRSRGGRLRSRKANHYLDATAVAARTIRGLLTVRPKQGPPTNPTPLAGTPSFCKARVSIQLIKNHNVSGRHLLHRLWWGRKKAGTKLANGREVFNRNDAVVWRIEQLE
jgi:hypothetical protein